MLMCSRLCKQWQDTGNNFLICHAWIMHILSGCALNNIMKPVELKGHGGVW